MYVTALLDFSTDPLSDITPTWTDVSAYLLHAKWSGGIQKEGEDPSPGQATFTLRNHDRRFEPDYAAGAFYPNIQDMRRFRWRVQNGVGSGTIYDEMIGYVQAWEPTEDGMDLRCVVTCVDGFGVMANDDLPQLDPPDASSYADVVGFDEPWGYWRLGETEGTQARANIIRGKRTLMRGGEKVRRRFKFRRGTRYVGGEAGGVAGPAGVYRNTQFLTFEQEGGVLGDSDTCVNFGSSGSTHGRMDVALDDVTMLDGRPGLTVECLVNLTALQTARVVGPVDAGGAEIWNMTVVPSTITLAGEIVGGGSFSFGGTGPGNDWGHCAVTIDRNNQYGRVYLNGVEVAGQSLGGLLDTPTADGKLSVLSADTDGGLIDEVAVYERLLPPERLLAHATAALERGYPEQTAGARIADIATHALWSEASIQTAGRDVQPMMKHGQSRLDEIAELVHSEGPRTMFYFNGTGGPEYRGWLWQESAAAYSTSQATFGNQTGEVPYANIGFVYDNETYNEIVASHEAGEAVVVSDATSDGQRGRRVNTEFTDILLMEHGDVEAIASEALELYKTPAFRPVTLTLDGQDSTARTQIFTRQIGHMIRVKHRPKGGTAIDRQAHIIGFEKELEMGEGEHGNLTCTWNLSRGFNAASAVWRLGYVGFTELNSTAVLG